MFYLSEVVDKMSGEIPDAWSSMTLKLVKVEQKKKQIARHV